MFGSMNGAGILTTGMPQDFAILSEESVAKGIRRIVAVAGDAALTARNELRDVCVSAILSFA